MKKEQITAVDIRKPGKGEDMPYELLLEADPSRELVDKYLSHSEVYVALLNDKVVGTYVLFPVSPEVVEIKNISVQDEYQGRGLGTLMLKDASIKAKEKNYKKIIIGTGNTSVGQLYLYQREGFDLTAITRDFFIKNYPEIIYENGIQVKHLLILTKDL
jgi:GNAT superfamily N-acetyltransferase